MRCLITGGAGFIGSHLVDRLLRDGHEVTILDNFAPRVHRALRPAWLSREARLVVGDVRDRGALLSALEGAEAVFHQAAYQDYMPDFSTFISTNAVSTALLYELIVEKRLPVARVIVASSQAVYGEGQYACGRHGLVQPPARAEARLRAGDWDVRCPSCDAPMRALPLEEEHTNPYNAYALSKRAGEMIALRLGRLHGVPTVALRYSITQGPRQSLFNAYSGICRIFSQRIRGHRPPVIYEDGRQTRDFVHVDDVVEANLSVLHDRRADGLAFNVGSGRATTVIEYAHALLEAFHSDLGPVVSGEYRAGDNRHSVSSIERLRALGWAPRHGLQRIFADFIAWLDGQGDGAGFLEEADAAMRQRQVVRRVAG
ncbi:MAG: NAD-dependent epimerase/dehydratase family protein [Acidobacteria bacterium]|nr:NAD-dependent epimerase/dehydratase family protein [Acidobacteriota bacterium]